ncbi:MAG: hypothetical protein R3325_01015 [Thermoanaerobaculia bacterium]|nr:hypothetical protein [Thermoanaerobaculia bacterium]
MADETLVWLISMPSMFAFLSVFWWALQRRREREAYYRYELARQLFEQIDDGNHHDYLDWLKEREAIEGRRRRQGMLLSALVVIASGAGFLIMFHGETGEKATIGWLPVIIGAAMLIFLALTALAGPEDGADGWRPPPAGGKR